MRFGLGQFTLQKPPWDPRSHAEIYADFLRIAELAEELGFDSIWLAEHHGASDGYIPSLLTMLSAVAARTDRLELGTAVMLAPFHDPIRVAEDAAVVDLISKGRLNLGLGLGWAQHEYEMFGVDAHGRGQRLGEFVQVLRAAWTQDRFDFDGRFLHAKDVMVRPQPQPPIRIWLGGNDERALRRAAVLADGHFPPSTSSPQAGVERAKHIVTLRRELGVEGPYRYGMFLPIGLGADADEAWASIRDGLLHVRGAYALWAGGERDVTNAATVAASFEGPTREGALCGTPEDVVGALRPAIVEIDTLGFEDAFVSAIIVTVGMPYEVAASRLKLYAERVMAPLRG
jgi:probable F420-dependent oxidoreductase